MIWHSDDEFLFRRDDTNDRETLIISLSFGATRMFGLRNKLSTKVLTQVALENKGLLSMAGLVQDEYEHCFFPGERESGEVRYNLTFRALRRHVRSCPMKNIILIPD